MVYGGGDYSQRLPAHSYISASDFQTARDLASHLLWLMENPSEYLKYFWWKSHYQIVEEINPQRPHSLPASFSCQLCQYLNTQTEHKQEWSKLFIFLKFSLFLLLSRSPTFKLTGQTGPSVRPGLPFIVTEIERSHSHWGKVRITSIKKTLFKDFKIIICLKRFNLINQRHL